MGECFSISLSIRQSVKMWEIWPQGRFSPVCGQSSALLSAVHKNKKTFSLTMHSCILWLVYYLFSHHRFKNKINNMIQRVRTLKGQCHEIFDFRFSTWFSFPQAHNYTIGAVSNFFENSRRYSQLKVQMEKIFNQKSFRYFFYTSLGSRVSLKINFFLQVYFKLSAVWYCSNLPPVSSIVVAICNRRRWRRWRCWSADEALVWGSG